MGFVWFCSSLEPRGKSFRSVLSRKKLMRFRKSAMSVHTFLRETESYTCPFRSVSIRFASREQLLQYGRIASERPKIVLASFRWRRFTCPGG